MVVAIDYILSYSSAFRRYIDLIIFQGQGLVAIIKRCSDGEEVIYDLLRSLINLHVDGEGSQQQFQSNNEHSQRYLILLFCEE